MTFKIERHEMDWNRSDQRHYRSGERLRVEISARFGFDTKTAILESLPKGRGFKVGKRVVRPPDFIWTDRGHAVAE